MAKKYIAACFEWFCGACRRTAARMGSHRGVAGRQADASWEINEVTEHSTEIITQYRKPCGGHEEQSAPNADRTGSAEISTPTPRPERVRAQRAHPWHLPVHTKLVRAPGGNPRGKEVWGGRDPRISLI